MDRFKAYKSVVSYIGIICLLKSLVVSNILIDIFVIAFLIILDMVYKNSTKTLVFSMFSPSYISIQVIIIYIIFKFLILKKNILKDKNYKIMICFILLIVCSYSISLLKDFSFVPFIIYMGTSFVVYLTYFVIRTENKDESRTFYCLCRIQVWVVIYQIVKLKSDNAFHPDSVKGTFDSCNTLAIYLIIYLLLIIFDSKKNTKKKIINILIFLPIIILVQAKIILGIFIISIGVVYIFIKKVLNINLKLGIVFVGIAISITIFTVSSSNISNILDKYGIEKYIYNQNMNLKFRAYEYTFKELGIIDDIIGVGVGRYGSKAANALAYDTMYKDENSLKMPSFIKARTSQQYYYVAALSTQEFYENIKWYSGILSYPQNSIITIKGELGFLGLLLLMIFAFVNIKLLKSNINAKLNVSYSYCAIVFIFFIGIANIFDNYLDMNNVILCFIFILASSYNKFDIEKEEKYSK